MVRSGVLVPVKSFRSAKGRLATLLDDGERGELARWLAARVLAAAGEMPTHVVCDDPEVAAWAERNGSSVVWSPGVGLNAAVEQGCAELERRGFDHVVVAHADLPRPGALAHVARADTIVLVPDLAEDGTNVLARPLAAAVTPTYGAGSFRRHLEAAMATGLPVHVAPHSGLSYDIDHPSDLAHPFVHEVLPPWLRTILANRH